MNLLFHLLVVFTFVAANYDYTDNDYIQNLRGNVTAFNLEECYNKCKERFGSWWWSIFFFKKEVKQLSKCMDQCYDYHQEYDVLQ